MYILSVEVLRLDGINFAEAKEKEQVLSFNYIFMRDWFR
jgi:hypothetical protein